MKNFLIDVADKLTVGALLGAGVFLGMTVLGWLL